MFNNASAVVFDYAALNVHPAEKVKTALPYVSDIEAVFRGWMAVQQPKRGGADTYTQQTIDDYCTALRDWLSDPVFSTLPEKSVFAFDDSISYMKFKSIVESHHAYSGFNGAPQHGPGRLHAAIGLYDEFLQDEEVKHIISIMKKITPFFAAIRTKPFILLAGISGTGKSRMVRQLARGCCPKWADAAKTVPHPFVDEQKPGNFEIIPVRPNWHDSTELMGYESRIGGAEFVIKPFVEFLIKAWMNPDIPFFLCLDEMNLAPVEQYFAEYLSAIESRKSVTGGGRTFFKTDVLVKMGAPETAWNDVGTTVLDKALKKLFESYKKADGALDAWPTYVREMFVKDGGVSIPPNLVVMGTVNMDETTCSFSRKVLDRAMSFELNDVSDMYDKNNLAAEKDLDFGCLGQTVTKCTMLTGAEAYAADNANGDKILKYLETVNKSLEGTPFKIAYRSRNEIMVYCVERTKGGVSLKSALDAATSMKILSRIEGDDQRFARFRLKEFRKTVVLALLKIDNDAAADADVTAFINDGEQVAASPSISKLTHMIEELEAGAGFVSYWE